MGRGVEGLTNMGRGGQGADKSIATARISRLRTTKIVRLERPGG
jgi:hypothetical protein